MGATTEWSVISMGLLRRLIVPDADNTGDAPTKNKDTPARATQADHDTTDQLEGADSMTV